MPGFLRQSTASQSRALGPFLDDTDFKTPETGLTIAATDIKLVVNGGASANKNSGGGTHRVNGVYGVTFDATDTATVGEIEVSVVVAGALPVFDKFTVVEEAVYDAFYVASAPGYVTTQIVASVSGNVGNVLAIAANAVNASALATDAVNEIAAAVVAASPTLQALVDAIWNELRSAHVVAGSFGEGTASVIAGVTTTTADQQASADVLLLRNLATGSSGTDSLNARTVQNALRRLRNKVSIAAGTATVTKENDSTSAWTAAVVTTPGDPVSSVDPA